VKTYWCLGGKEKSKAKAGRTCTPSSEKPGKPFTGRFPWGKGKKRGQGKFKWESKKVVRQEPKRPGESRQKARGKGKKRREGEKRRKKDSGSGGGTRLTL